MDASAIGWIITGVFAFILFVSTLVGMKRGLAKSAFRFGWVTVTSVILIFVTPLVSKWLNNFDISSFNIDIEGQTITKLSDIGAVLCESFLGEDVLFSNPNLASFVSQAPIMVLNILVFVLLFWITKWLLWIVWAIIAHKVFDKQEIEKKKFKKEQAQKTKKGIKVDSKEQMPVILSVKQTKHPLWGALFGLLLGIIICASTFMPVIGLNDTFQNVYTNVTYKEGNKEIPYLSKEIDEETLSYINCYENSVANKIATYSGVKFLSGLTFLSLTSIDVDGNKINLTNEINGAVKIYANVMECISIFDDIMIDNELNKEKLTQKKISDLIENANLVFDNISDSGFVGTLGNELVPYLIDKEFSSEKIEISGIVEIDNIIKDALKDKDNLKIKQIISQLRSMLDIVDEANRKNLIVPILASDEEMTVDYILNVVDTNLQKGDIEGFVSNIVDNLYNISILEDKYPEFVNSGFKMLFESLDRTFAEQEIAPQTIKENVKKILGNALKIAKLYNKSEKFDFDSNKALTETQDNTSEVLGLAGETLDTIYCETSENNWFSKANYTTLMNYLCDYIVENTSEIGDLEAIVNNLLMLNKKVDENDTKVYSTWGEELTKFTKLYSAIIKAKNSDSLSIEKMSEDGNNTLVNIGAGLDGVVSGKIVTNEIIKDLLNEFLDKEEFEDINDILGDAKATLLKNIWNASANDGQGGTQVVSWATEMATIKKILVEKDNLASGDLTEIGKALDKISDSKIFSKSVINEIVGNKFDEILNNNQTTFGDKGTEGTLANVLAGIKDNISEIVSYEKEFGNLKSLIDVATATYVDDTEGTNPKTANEKKLEAIGSCFDTICDKANSGANASKFITKDNIKSIITYFFNDKTTGIDSNYNTVVDEIGSKILETTNYSTMFQELNEVVASINDLQGNKDDFISSADGAVFDRLAKMSEACDEDITHNIVKTLFTKVFGYNTVSHEYGYYNSIINGTYDFDNYNGGTDNYYADLFNAIKSPS